VIAAATLFGDEIAVTLDNAYFVFQIIQFLSIASMFFLVQQFIMLIFIKRLGRDFEFPSIIQIMDILQFVSSMI